MYHIFYPPTRRTWNDSLSKTVVKQRHAWAEKHLCHNGSVPEHLRRPRRGWTDDPAPCLSRWDWKPEGHSPGRHRRPLRLSRPPGVRVGNKKPTQKNPQKTTQKNPRKMFFLCGFLWKKYKLFCLKQIYYEQIRHKLSFIYKKNQHSIKSLCIY